MSFLIELLMCLGFLSLIIYSFILFVDTACFLICLFVRHLAEALASIITFVIVAIVTALRDEPQPPPPPPRTRRPRHGRRQTSACHASKKFLEELAREASVHGA